MIKHPENDAIRELKRENLSADIVIVGGGMAGTCCAIQAAREGIKVVLVQDRPVLGGNASSEVRLWILGATSHMGNNNRWAREGGVIDEILLENAYRNKEGNPVLIDAIILEKVIEEPNITLLLNTTVLEASKESSNRIASVKAFCGQNSTEYRISAPLFVDASGDGILGFLSGAAFRIGAEAQDEFDEGLAQDKANSELLGHSIYFYTKDTGSPVQFIPPSFALSEIEKIPRYKNFNARQHGCQLWWIEYGGNLDTVHETEKIKWELWKVAYGVWDYIKNSGKFPEAETMTLEWVGTIPGKRESRRFEGDYMISQRDLVERRQHNDAVAYGGWAIDLHPADGVYSEQSGCTQFHSKGIYQIPYRCMYSRNIENLFLAGRILSASHIAFGSTRVMATCASNAQAVAVAAAHCIRDSLMPRELLEKNRMHKLQGALLRSGQHIPEVAYDDEDNLAAAAIVRTSSNYVLHEMEPGVDTVCLDDAWAMMIPIPAGDVPVIDFWASTTGDTELEIQLRTASDTGHFTPDTMLASKMVSISSLSREHHLDASTVLTAAGLSSTESYTSVDVTDGDYTRLSIDFETTVNRDQYVFVCFMANPTVQLRLSDQRVTGVLSLIQRGNKAVAKHAVQTPPENSGIDTFEFWRPQRRPNGKNIAFRLDEALEIFSGDVVKSAPFRPTNSPNAWIARPDDTSPTLTLAWETDQLIDEIHLHFDTDFDHPLESVLMGHPEPVMPFCVQSYRVFNEQGQLLFSRSDNHQSTNIIRLNKPVKTNSLRIEVDHPDSGAPAALMGISCYSPSPSSMHQSNLSVTA